MRNSKRAEGGFSLIELIIVLVLIGIAMAVTAPSIFRVLERIEIRAAVKEISSSIRYGRSMAISKKRETHFYINLDERLFWITTPQDERALREYEEKEPEEGETLVKNIYTLKKRSIDPLIKIEHFARGGDEIDVGTIRITFSHYGNCTGGLIRVVGAKESDRPLVFEIKVDPVTGRVKTKELKEDSDE